MLAVISSDFDAFAYHCQATDEERTEAQSEAQSDAEGEAEGEEEREPSVQATMSCLIHLRTAIERLISKVPHLPPVLMRPRYSQ